MRVTVLGKSPSWQDAGGACSGYLVQHDELTLLLDCGNGVFSKLRSLIDYTSIGEVVISHLHADHFLDLIPFSYALANAARSGRLGDGADCRRPTLHLPPGGRAVLRRIVGSWGSEELVDDAFAIAEYEPGDELQVETLHVRFTEVPHFVRSHAVELSTDGARFVFGADCGPNEALVRFALDADLLMVEGTLSEPDPGPDRGHMTPREAGEHGAAAHARRLVLTHYSDEMDAAWVAAESAAGYGRDVELAHEGAVYAL
ncbi:MAG TPA: MBL fold metallo-hydrolase [Solirubrobacteraceae bacterium]|nr:MBL fold metallo-hydrolase [Solirubrobacteraceae bacterium]